MAVLRKYTVYLTLYVFLQFIVIILFNIKSAMLQKFKKKLIVLPLRLFSSTYQPSIQMIRFDMVTTPKLLIKYIVLNICFFFFNVSPIAMKLLIDITRQIYSINSKYLIIFRPSNPKKCFMLSFKSPFS